MILRDVGDFAAEISDEIQRWRDFIVVKEQEKVDLEIRIQNAKEEAESLQRLHKAVRTFCGGEQIMAIRDVEDFQEDLRSEIDRIKDRVLELINQKTKLLNDIDSYEDRIDRLEKLSELVDAFVEAGYKYPLTEAMAKLDSQFIPIKEYRARLGTAAKLEKPQNETKKEEEELERWLRPI